MQDQQVYVLQLSQEITAMASHSARTHIVSHPELGAVLDQNGVPSFAASNSTTSTNPSSSGSPQIRSSDPNSPRGPQSGPSPGQAPVSEISLDSSDQTPLPGILSDATGHAPVTDNPAHLSDYTPVAEILIPEEHAPVSGISSDHVPGLGRSSPDSEPGTSGAQPPSPIPAGNGQSWVPTALFGRPEPSIRPPNSRQSGRNLAERPVIVNDSRGLREEHRRPRRVSVSS